MDPLRVVDMRPIKDGFRRKLPPGHMVREAILDEPDELTWNEAAVKLRTYGTMLVRQGA